MSQDIGDAVGRASQRCAERSVAFHADGLERSMCAHPRQQCAVAGVGRRELLMTKQPPVLIDHRGIVSVFMGVDATDARLRRAES